MQCKSRARIEAILEIRFVHADLQGKRCTRAWQTRVNKFRRVCNATLKRTYRHCNRFNWIIPLSVNYSRGILSSSIDYNFTIDEKLLIEAKILMMIEIEERQMFSIEFSIRSV